MQAPEDHVMCEVIQKDIGRLSLAEQSTSSKKVERPPWYFAERWVYGYAMTNRFILRTARKYGLPWETNSFHTLIRVEDHVGYMADVDYRVESVRYRGRTTLILFFVEDDGRKRLDENEFSKEQMDRVRKALELPEGTQPRWYEVHGQYPEGTTFDSEDDETWDEDKPRESMVDKCAKKYEVIDMDDMDDSDDEDEMEEE